MRKFLEIPLYQKIINKIDAKQPFTHKLSDTEHRYIVSVTSIYEGKNPSLEFDLIVYVKSILDNKDIGNVYSNFGGYCKLDGTYSLDFNKGFNDLSVARKVSRYYNQEAIWDTQEKKIIIV